MLTHLHTRYLLDYYDLLLYTIVLDYYDLLDTIMLDYYDLLLQDEFKVSEREITMKEFSKALSENRVCI